MFVLFLLYTFILLFQSIVSY